MNFRFSRIWRNLTLVSVALTALMVLTGCSTARMYDGPTKSKDQVAVLFRHANFVKIESVDGQSIPLLKRARVLELLPGSHTVECNFRFEYMDTGYASAAGTNGAVRLNFDAKAGYTYWIDANVDPVKQEWHPKIIARPNQSEEPAK